MEAGFLADRAETLQKVPNGENVLDASGSTQAEAWWRGRAGAGRRDAGGVRRQILQAINPLMGRNAILERFDHPDYADRRPVSGAVSSAADRISKSWSRRVTVSASRTNGLTFARANWPPAERTRRLKETSAPRAV